ncbi:hypothetical protein C8046_11650 [Serinibacter arcticus]|uniref:Uncharacterized protein n=1 Tax=Serinibacter arcticus TaxID=1655435 RepID=A0A2U1ZW37_9MICO|nr:hypothetical protein [Serinibacter arcticus]PWD51207.1 hypothetical protein C8046_11650 [Serinibacter arcticus]
MAHGFDDWSDWSAGASSTPSSASSSPDPGWSGDPQAAARPTLAAARPPVLWLWLALASGLLGGALALALGQSIVIAVATWVVAGPTAFALLSQFTSRDTRLRSAPLYVAPTWVPLLYRATVVVALLGIACAAWRIADWAGRTW